MSGNENTAIGSYTLYSNTSGLYNTAIGSHALTSNSTGILNTANGTNALFMNTDGSGNTAIGYSALHGNTTGEGNTATGYLSLSSNKNGYYNTGVGQNSIGSNTSGHYNSGSGFESLYNNTTGVFNTGMGSQSLLFNTTGHYNSASGAKSLYNNTTGTNNAALGYSALYNNTLGWRNAAMGFYALYSNTSGSNNTALGTYADVSTGNLENATAIGYHTIVNASNKVVIGNSNVTVIGGPVNWSKLSDGRFKNNIKQNVPGLAFINKLKPVTYNLELKKFDKFLGKKDSLINTLKDAYARGEKKIHTGFIAQEVEKAAKELNYDFDGVNAPTNDKDNYSIAYADFVPSLVRSVQELSAQNDSLRSELNELKQLVLSIQQKQKNAAAGNSETVSNASISLSNESPLLQNTPNPFNNITVINYNLPKQYTTATIIVSDKNGKTIKQINISGSGKGSLKIDGSALAAGTYNYSLVINGQKITTRQMMVLK